MVRKRQALKPGLIELPPVATRRIEHRAQTPVEPPPYDPRMRRCAGWMLLALNLLLWSAIAWGISLLF
jgi:hypothetical protein